MAVAGVPFMIIPALLPSTKRDSFTGYGKFSHQILRERTRLVITDVAASASHTRLRHLHLLQVGVQIANQIAGVGPDAVRFGVQRAGIDLAPALSSLL